MSNTISAAVSKLTEIVIESPIDWRTFDDVLLSLEDINFVNKEYDETILSELLTGGVFFHRGKELTEAVRHFLVAGYDVTANEGQNGGFVLSALLWSSYDKYILNAAKILMDAGAPIIYTSIDDDPNDEPDGLLGNIEWKMPGVWTIDKDYGFANILEAYYEIAKANLMGLNYHSIYCYQDCLGKKLSKISAVRSKDAHFFQPDRPVSKFSDALIMWFGDSPLVISRYVDFVINPIFAKERMEDTVDVSSEFAILIGASIQMVNYIDPSICYFDFDNGYRIIFASRDMEDGKRIGTYEIRLIEESKNLESLDIDKICGRKGYTYANTVTDYDEDALALFCNNEAYLLGIVPGNSEKYQIKLLKCSTDLLAEYARQYPIKRPKAISCYYEDKELTSARFEYDNSFLYLKTTDCSQIEVQLSYDKYDPSECLSLRSKDGQHMDFQMRELKSWK